MTRGAFTQHGPRKPPETFTTNIDDFWHEANKQLNDQDNMRDTCMLLEPIDLPTCDILTITSKHDPDKTRIPQSWEIQVPEIRQPPNSAAVTDEFEIMQAIIPCNKYIFGKARNSQEVLLLEVWTDTFETVDLLL